jgi:hypothetical protein
MGLQPLWIHFPFHILDGRLVYQHPRVALLLYATCMLYVRLYTHHTWRHGGRSISRISGASAWVTVKLESWKYQRCIPNNDQLDRKSPSTFPPPTPTRALRPWPWPLCRQKNPFTHLSTVTVTYCHVLHEGRLVATVSV